MIHFVYEKMKNVLITLLILNLGLLTPKQEYFTYVAANRSLSTEHNQKSIRSQTLPNSSYLLQLREAIHY